MMVNDGFEEDSVGEFMYLDFELAIGAVEPVRSVANATDLRFLHIEQGSELLLRDQRSTYNSRLIQLKNYP